MTFILLLLHAWLDGADGREKHDAVTSWVWCMALWTLLLLAMTEALSLLRLLRFRVLLVCWWGTALLLGIALLLRVRKMKKQSLPLPKFPRPRGAWLLAAVPALGLLSLAVYTVPYNFDSMTYHLARIAHWAQAGTVAHYATNIVRQLVNPNLTEFVDLHVYLLCAKNDLLLNVPQTAAHIACAGLVYAVSRKLGCDVRPSALAGLLCFCMPIAFAEALSTQTDGFATLWLLSFVYVLLDFVMAEDKLCFDAAARQKAVLLGLLVALGYLTKPSVSIGMLLLAVWLLFNCLARRDKPLVLIKLALCALPAVVLPILPEALRNLHTFGALSDPIMSQDLLVGTFRPLYLLVNMCKNLAVNMPTVLVYHSERLAQAFVEGVSALTGVPVTAPDIGGGFLLYPAPAYWQDYAVSPLVFYAAMAAMLFAAVRRCRMGFRGLLRSYSLAVLLVFLAFCAVLRWDRYGARYLLGYLALLCPAVACFLQKLPQKNGARTAAAGVLAFLCAAQTLSLSIYHVELAAQAGPRPEGYFAANTEAYEPYMGLCNAVVAGGYQKIGLAVREGDYEYPLWYFAKVNGARLEHVLVQNASAVYEDESFVPDCVFWANETPPLEPLTVHGQTYETVWKFGELYLLAAND